MKNEAKYEKNEKTGVYDILYRGFSYKTLRVHQNWTKIAEADTEEEAKEFCENCLSFGEDDD